MTTGRPRGRRRRCRPAFDVPSIAAAAQPVLAGLPDGVLQTGRPGACRACRRREGTGTDGPRACVGEVDPRGPLTSGVGAYRPAQAQTIATQRAGRSRSAPLGGHTSVRGPDRGRERQDLPRETVRPDGTEPASDSRWIVVTRTGALTSTGAPAAGTITTRYLEAPEGADASDAWPPESVVPETTFVQLIPPSVDRSRMICAFAPLGRPRSRRTSPGWGRSRKKAPRPPTVPWRQRHGRRRQRTRRLSSTPRSRRSCSAWPIDRAPAERRSTRHAARVRPPYRSGLPRPCRRPGEGDGKCRPGPAITWRPRCRGCRRAAVPAGLIRRSGGRRLDE